MTETLLHVTMSGSHQGSGQSAAWTWKPGKVFECTGLGKRMRADCESSLSGSGRREKHRTNEDDGTYEQNDEMRSEISVFRQDIWALSALLNGAIRQFQPQ